MIDLPIRKSNSTNYFFGEIKLGNMKKAIYRDCTIIHVTRHHFNITEYWNQLRLFVRTLTLVRYPIRHGL